MRGPLKVSFNIAQEIICYSRQSGQVGNRGYYRSCVRRRAFPTLLSMIFLEYMFCVSILSVSDRKLKNIKMSCTMKTTGQLSFNFFILVLSFMLVIFQKLSPQLVIHRESQGIPIQMGILVQNIGSYSSEYR